MDTWPRHRIIIIDDNPDIHRDFERILIQEKTSPELARRRAAIFGNRDASPAQEFACDLTFASQGRDGVEKIRHSLVEGLPYEVAFVDMRMPPGWDGLETIAELWKVDPRIQVVICTAYADYSQEEIAQRLGPTDRLLILKKPFDSLEVTQLVRSLTERAKVERAFLESRQHLELALSGASLATWEFDLKTRRTRFSNRWRRVLGYDEDDPLPAEGSWEKIIHPDDLEQTMAKLRAHVRGETESFEAEFRIKTKQGDYIWITSQGKIVRRSPSGRATRMAGTIRDITEAKSAQLALAESEERFRHLIENTPLPLAVIDKDDRIEYLNHGFVEVLGYDRNDVPSLQEWWPLAYPDPKYRHAVQTTWYEEIAKHRETGGGIAFREFKVACKDGRVRLMEFIATFIGDRWIAQFRDVTKRHAAEEALRVSEEKYRTLADSLPLVIFETDLEGRLQFLNRYGFTFTGFAPADLAQGLSAFDVVAPESRELMRANMQKVASGELALGNEYVCLKRDGSSFPCVVYATRIMSGGSPVGSRGVVLDMTERKRAEKELEAAHRELVDTARRAGMAEVATGVLHNVGNVLNSVGVAATTMERLLSESRLPYLEKTVKMLENHSEDLAAFLTSDERGRRLPSFLRELAQTLEEERSQFTQANEKLKRYVHHVTEIINRQQSYGKTSSVREAALLDEVVEDALEINAKTLQNSGIIIKREYASLPPVVLDRAKLMQIIANLVSNAEYALAESERPEKTLAVRISEPLEGKVQVQVADNGMGIAPENITRIFAYGFTTRPEGHGFGLHTGALAAHQMDGSLTAHSDGCGKGATFTLEIPYIPGGSGYGR